MLKSFLIPIAVLSLFLVMPVMWAQAQEMRSNSFSIQFGNFNTTSGQKSSANYNVTDTVGQVGSGPYGQYGSSSYFVGGGFQYIYQIDTFSFTISRIAVDLGVLTPGLHNTASHTLRITTKGAGGYQVFAYEQRPLQTQGGIAVIPDTTCNAGSCDQVTAQVWTTQTIPGFGFNMAGNDIPADFVNNTFFRQFANRAASEAMQVVMSSANIANSRISTVTYKAGVSGSQAAGNYQTGVAYVAVPGY